ncbi:helix-turn-helix transcriptional regulator [Brevibacillus parabrevis]|uniref:helix-turn-helix transcriptional regulator n=1 Tax=Brevibacillus parabrevis TaxID=54914 RepID=UPI002E22F2E0|nr:helix-turn-helix transcriptional regulator [Brevibacillus parabrevis]
MLRYSVPHLSALFKKKTGYSLIDYLIRVRMEKAASLLVETDRQLREIAESVGYREPYYFGRLFKKVYGKSIRNIARAFSSDKSTDAANSRSSGNHHRIVHCRSRFSPLY